jgi:hypothetical protein
VGKKRRVFEDPSMRRVPQSARQALLHHVPQYWEAEAGGTALRAGWALGTPGNRAV